jgi:hypothetical protein
VTLIPDGTYDAFVVDATPIEVPAGAKPAWHLDLTILAGDLKGDVVGVRADGLAGDEFDLIGMPGTLRVENGEPAFELDT